MSEQIVVPVLGESITEATVAKWLKNVGDTVEADEPVVELETDKVNLEVPSPVSGTVGDIKFKDGDVVEVGAVLGSIQTNGQPIKNQTEEKKSEPKIEEENNVISLKKEKNQIEKTEEETTPKVFEEENEEQPLVLINEVAEKEKEKKSDHLSPSVRKLVSENKIDLDKVKGTAVPLTLSKSILFSETNFLTDGDK